MMGAGIIDFGLVAVVLLALVGATGAIFAWSRISVEMRVLDAVKIEIKAAQSEASEARKLVEAWDDEVQHKLHAKIESLQDEVRVLRRGLSDCEDRYKSLHNRLSAMRRWSKDVAEETDLSGTHTPHGEGSSPPAPPGIPQAPSRSLHFGRKVA